MSTGGTLFVLDANSNGVVAVSPEPHEQWYRPMSALVDQSPGCQGARGWPLSVDVNRPLDEVTTLVALSDQWSNWSDEGQGLRFKPYCTVILDIEGRILTSRGHGALGNDVPGCGQNPSGQGRWWGEEDESGGQRGTWDT